MIYPVVSLVNAVIVVLVLLPNSLLSSAHKVQLSLGGRKFALPVLGARKKAPGRQQWIPTLPMIMSRGGKAQCKLVS